MPIRRLSRLVHVLAGTGAMLVIALLLATSLQVLVGAGPGGHGAHRAWVVEMLFVLVPCLALAGLSGWRLSPPGARGVVARKMWRMRLVALIGLFVLVPLALVLDHLARQGAAGAGVLALELAELAFGSLNLVLLAGNLRDGLRLGAARRGAQPLS